MSDYRYFDAPWSAVLKVVTILTTLALAALVPLGLAGDRLPPATRLAMLIAGPLGILAGALFIIRGYELSKDTLYVARLGWRSRVSLAGLKSVVVDPKATCWSLRSCGNGGFFSFTGWYANRRLGSYRLFGTDLKRAVVLDLGTRRVVVTPDEPESFARSVRDQTGLK